MTTTRMRIASTLAMMLGALAGNETMPSAFDARPRSGGPAPRNQHGNTFWPRRGSLRDVNSGEGTYNIGSNAHKRARRRLERHLRADAVAAAGGRKVPKHRLAY